MPLRMFIKFRQSGRRLNVSLVETRRRDGKVRNHHVAALGSIVTEPTVADRVAFWNRAGERLEALGNRLGPEADKIEAALYERSPIPTAEELRALQIENAHAEQRMFKTIVGIHGATAARHKAVATAATAQSTESATAAAKGAGLAAQAGRRCYYRGAGQHQGPSRRRQRPQWPHRRKDGPAACGRVAD
jgi:hypothetical protein